MNRNILNIDEVEKEVRKQMFAFRNGIIADTLRRAGLPHEVIFGLNLPQIKEIATPLLEAEEGASDCEQTAATHELALRLWADEKCREARLLACHLFDPARADEEFLLGIVGSLRSREEADVLRLRLLRKLPTNPAVEEALNKKGYPSRI